MLREIENHYTDWVLAVMLLSIFLILLSRIYNSRKFTSFLYLPVRKGEDAEGEFNPLGWRNPFDVLMAINAFLSLSLAVLLVNYYSSSVVFSYQSWYNYLRIFLILSSFFLVKSLLQLAVAWAFDKVEAVALSQNIELSYWSWTGLIVLPLCILVVFVSPFREINTWLLLVIIFGGWLQAFFRSGLHLWKIPASGYYKFFYLCGLEIIPFIFLIKWMQVV